MTAGNNNRGTSLGDTTIEGLLKELTAIRADMIAETIKSKTRLSKVHPHYQASARNLLHYLALRRRDLRPLQHRLAEMGLSSLGRAESHVLATVDAVLEVLHRLAQRSWQPPSTEAAVLDFAGGQRLLAEHTEALLGPAPPQRGVRIMVTMPSEAADDYMLVHDLLQQGMDCMRINCAHDDAAAWLRMIEHLRRAEQTLGRSCRIVDGPGRAEAAHRAARAGPGCGPDSPRRDIYGRVTAPARVWLTPDDCAPLAPFAGGGLPPRASDVAGPPSPWRTGETHRRPGRQTDLRNRGRDRSTGAGRRQPRRRMSSPAQSCVTSPGRADRDDRESVVGELPAGENAHLPPARRPAHPAARPQTRPPCNPRQCGTSTDPRLDRLHHTGGVR